MTIHDVDERSPFTYTATFVDAAGAPIALAALETLTITLYNASEPEPTPATANIINGRSKQDAKNVNQVTFHATSGLLTWDALPADNPIVDATRGYELHVALFEYTTTGGVPGRPHEVGIRVRNLRKVA